MVLKPVALSVFIVIFLAALFSTALASDTKTVRVAICQIFSLDGDRSGNFTRIENALREAKDAGADIAAFPETSILGWVNSDAHELAYPIPGKDSARLCKLAAKHEIFISVGLAEKEGSNLYDTALLIDDTGKILLKHRKINILSWLMTPPYTPGEDVSAVETKHGKIGLLICADTFQDDILERMAALKPDILLVPYGWAAPEEKWPEHGMELLKTVTKTAQSIGAAVVGVDLVGEISKGPWTGQVYGGQSVAADRKGNVLAVARDRDREIKIVTITLDK